MNYHGAYIAGCGLAGLATAYYLVNDAQINPEKIRIFESSKTAGGSLDATAVAERSHYFMRGFRMLESKVYSAFFDFISGIPMEEQTNKTLFDDFIAFNNEVKTFSQSRLIESGKAINSRQFKLKFTDRVKVLILLTKSEDSLEGLTIKDYFSSDFFNSNFWLQFSTTFSFQAWHSLEEFKRYILRFIQCSPVLDSQTCIRSTRYNQYESVVAPVKRYLKQKGVTFIYDSRVTNADFVESDSRLRISCLEIENGTKAYRQSVSDTDLVFLTLGSMATSFSAGSMQFPPSCNGESDQEWDLWRSISRVSREFGNPEAFIADTSASQWVSFTITFSNPEFLQSLENITKTKAGQEGPITIKDSNWLISFALPNHPHFINQPEHLHILWGYGMYSDKIGNFVKKTLPECNGKEILFELIHHLKFEDKLETIMNDATCIPCMLPYITSQFMPRYKSDRPAVVPGCADNFAFIGQYCDIPDDIVFTLEYSVRSAQIAVFTYLDQLEKVTPIYKGWHRLKHMFDAFRTAFR